MFSLKYQRTFYYSEKIQQHGRDVMSLFNITKGLLGYDNTYNDQR